jgi:hypothetical protein
MSRITDQALAISRPAIQILIVVNVFYAASIAGLLATSLFSNGWVERALGFDLSPVHPWLPLGVRAIAVIGIVSAAIVHSILQRLLAIVDAVRIGDPFVLENAQRLEAIAWRVFALEALRLVVAATAAVTWIPGRITTLSIAPWVAVLLLFVLAGVFAQGARMRADLDGTV